MITGELIAIGSLTLLNILQGLLTLSLVNRLMSRNYYDFKVSEQVNVKPSPAAPKIPDENEFEDLGYLSGI